jgi:hypothetical protein
VSITHVLGSRTLFPVAALALVLLPVPLSGQARTSAPNEVVWHWFGACTSGDSLVLEVHLDGRPLYSSAFPICQTRRSAIKPEPQQRVLGFRFDAEPRRFRTQERARGMQPIAGNVWEAGGERDAIRLGVSFATEQQVLLNTIHVARARAPSRSERVRGLVITTRPSRASPSVR